MVEIISPNVDRIETIEVSGNIEQIYGVKSSKSFRGYMNSRIKHCLSRGDKETEMMLRAILGVYDKFHSDKVRVELNGWKGKDEIQFIEKPTSFDIITHQKPDQDSEPKETKHNISKKEINDVIYALNNCKASYNKENEEYKDTKDIAEEFCRRRKITHNDKDNNLWANGFEWGRFFADRHLHNNLNLCLRLLDRLEVIKYRAGRSYILKGTFSFDLNI